MYHHLPYDALLGFATLMWNRRWPIVELVIQRPWPVSSRNICVDLG
jgi:hypothetical protein